MDPTTVFLYALNKDVDAHNERMLNDMGGAVETISAIYNMNTADDMLSAALERNRTDALPSMLRVCVGARVMLLHNIDVTDRLANGALGVATSFIRNRDKQIIYICVEFDDPTAGRRRRFTHAVEGTPGRSVAIGRITRQVRTSSSQRITQFPLRLAWGLTIHKSQGSTYASVAVSHRGIRTPNQAYVAYSRATSLQGLHLVDDEFDKIFCDATVCCAIRQWSPTKIVYAGEGRRRTYANV